MDELDRIRALLPGEDVTLVDALGGSNRSVVRRVRAGDRTLIVKEYTDGGDGWLRESASLAVLPPEAPGPRLVAAGADPPIVVLSDLGSGPSVADALLGTDPVAARDAIVAWATATGAMHRTTVGVRSAYQKALIDRGAAGPDEESRMAPDLAEAAATVAGLCADLDIVVPSGALDELKGLAARLDGEGPAALTPADTCPDNNIRVGDRLYLIDFEGAQWRHLAWDAAYLRVPWPTCWCAWRIPDEVAATALDAYRAEVDVPYVWTPEFVRDMAVAAAGRTFVSTGWFLSRALADEDPPAPDPAKPMPGRRALILYRLGAAAQVAELPRLAEFAGQLATVLRRRWGPVELAYAPAFR